MRRLQFPLCVCGTCVGSGAHLEWAQLELHVKIPLDSGFHICLAPLAINLDSFCAGIEVMIDFMWSLMMLLFSLSLYFTYYIYITCSIFHIIMRDLFSPNSCLMITQQGSQLIGAG